MRIKDKAFDKFLKFFYLVEHQFGKKFKYLHTNFENAFIIKVFDIYIVK